ncbi:unnamed protein product [Oppiella nova]|uniref:F-box domain-containing protein n=1 Tax=Oppiella nova TaxID=334625 RepID=A0A7R9LRN8_9ACAR|nr:unnamed protein product [Oppiella nova]CAG2165681.1 unnamed protein product [Oppiella nova]
MSAKKALLALFGFKTKTSRNDTNDTPEEYTKDSFDRFGDDLCGLVLSYLSLKDSHNFEYLSKQWMRCLSYLSLKDSHNFEYLSKQWMRCVFTRRHTLSVGDIRLKMWQIRDNNNISDNNLKALESVVKKCANITSIDIHIHSEANERVFEILVNSYKNLKRIDNCLMDETFFDSIHTYLPHLQVLNVKNLLEMSASIEKSALMALFGFKTNISTNAMNSIEEEYTKNSLNRFSDDLCKELLSNKSLKEYPKNSFDRFGDGLCEEILSYLSLKDCFRFECLSKQWKRLALLALFGFKTKTSRNDTNGTQEEYPKDSFDRFGDDLCGLVLSYLSLEDCFRFECLSKQWMRCVFTRRHTFSMSDIPLKTLRLRDVIKISDNNWKLFESMLTITAKSLSLNGHNSRDISFVFGVQLVYK